MSKKTRKVSTFKDPITDLMMRRCGKCGRTLELNSTNFHKDKSKKHGFQGWCKKCMGEAAKRQNARCGTPNERMGKPCHWASLVVANGNKRTQPGAVCDLTREQMIAKYESTSHCECGCGEELPALEMGIKAGFQADHDVPIADGGGHTIDNIKLLLNKCHAKKTKAEQAARADKAVV